MTFNTEEIGISAEIAIADAYNVPVDQNYRQRGNTSIINIMLPRIVEIFQKSNIPNPSAHIAEGQNPIDFQLVNNQTLSVKTNQKFSQKVAPQNVGQPTSKTYFEYFSHLYNSEIPDDYASRSKLFKQVSMDKIDEVMAIYWENLFDCDHLIHFYDLIDNNGNPNQNFEYRVHPYMTAQNFKKSEFSFTQTIDSWNESCTVKYYGISIGEFQVHRKRDCFKFRFNMDGVNNIIAKNLI